MGAQFSVATSLVKDPSDDRGVAVLVRFADGWMNRESAEALARAVRALPDFIEACDSARKALTKVEG